MTNIVLYTYVILFFPRMKPTLVSNKYILNITLKHNLHIKYNIYLHIRYYVIRFV